MNQPPSRASFSPSKDRTDLADRSTSRVSEEVLILDARSDLRPAELVERKLIALLKGTSASSLSRHRTGRGRW